jgi:hypothetical protein
MRLYYHPESDSLFWADFCDDPFCDDVTDEAKFQDAAADRGIFCPGPISKVIEQGKIIPDEDVARVIAPLTGGLAGAIQASHKKWERKPSDFYPTPYEGTESLMPVVKLMVPEGGKIWEPCCGDMDMTRVLEWHGFEVTSTDLRDTGQGISGIDFLTDDPETKLGWIPDPDMIVMNPPFSLAYEFIVKALSYTPNVACLLKIDYWNAISRYELFQTKRPLFVFPLTWRLAFLKSERGNSPLMNCMWVVWADETFNDVGDKCIFEPMKKIAYPGYNSDGVRTKLAKLGQAVDDLAQAIRK